MADPSAPLRPGTLLGDRYRIEELIGCGGFGAVFRATQLALGREVAVKVMLPGVVRDDSLLRFQREATLAQRLAHPNTVRVIDFGTGPEGAPFLVFELLQGRTLESEVVRTRGLSAARVAHVAVQILKSLMEAHGLGIVHRDIKPANVFLCDFEGERDFVKVLDFGIASSGDARPLTRPGEVLGTPRYMAPEQVAGRGATFASDLYALGILMAEGLSGGAMFPGLTGFELIREKLSDRPTPIRPEVLASPLGPVIHRATQMRPERRYPSAAEMLAHIDAVTVHARSIALPRPAALGDQPTDMGVDALMPPAWAGAPVVPPPPNAVGKEKGKPSGAPWAVLVTLALAVMALCAAFWIAMTRSDTPSDAPRESARPDAGEPTSPPPTAPPARPVVLTGSHANRGWTVFFHIAERATAIEYKRPSDPDFVSLGLDQHLLDPGTNQALPRSHVSFAEGDLEGRVPFDVRYRTADGQLHGPYRLVFDTDAELVANSKANLDQEPLWIAIHDVGNKKRLCYFSSVLSERPAIRAIRYGFDADPPDRTLRLSTAKDAPGPIKADDEVTVPIPPQTTFITVEVTFIDGSTKKRRFPNRLTTTR